MTIFWRAGLAVLSVSLAAGSAEAATCTFDEASGLLTVDLAGTRAFLKATATDIRLGNTPCGAATTSNTARIVVNGNGSGPDWLSLRGRFAPGRDDVPEVDDPEIEIELVGGWTDFADTLAIHGAARRDVWRISAAGINLNEDGDTDVTAPASGVVYLTTLGNQDLVDASAYTGAARFDISGGDGADTRTGGPGSDVIRGEAGDDSLFGLGGDDSLLDGGGQDVLFGGPGNDGMVSTTGAPDPGDDFRGGAGQDSVSYGGRANPVRVTIDNVADDGEPGENDNVHLDVENLTGGDGDDVLVGSDADNFLAGGYSVGYDELYGGGGDDALWCINTDGCFAVGDAGNDTFYGSDRDDVLDGGPGDDDIVAHNGNDVITGGPGVDFMDGRGGDDEFHNADGFADTVDCFFGNDTYEIDPLDTFLNCSN